MASIDHISMQQVLSNLSFQRLKLCNKLQCEPSSKHENEDCCKEDLSEEVWEYIESCFQKTSTLTDIEKSTLYYISGNVAKKHSIIVEDDIQTERENPVSEFLNLVSRGKLHHLQEVLFDLSMHLFCYKCVDKTCIKRLLKGFMEIYNLTGFNFEGKQMKILTEKLSET